ncbi:hypothetical protein ACGFI9_01485 [Micromonospora sp. NPDC048930]|uniref:hypothetical protein n=1 Tax=Micromonospora sp. NPDC048930 TaxID=3364261 RepID=UPI0037147345
MAAKQAQPYEVLVEAANGHRTVHRVQAADKAAAERAVTVDDGDKVLDAAPAGSGVGSGDRQM